MYIINHPAIGDLPFMQTPIWMVPRITFFKICLTTVPFFSKGLALSGAPAERNQNPPTKSHLGRAVLLKVFLGLDQRVRVFHYFMVPLYIYNYIYTI